MASAAVNALPAQFLRGIVNDVPAYMPPMNSSISVLTNFLNSNTSQAGGAPFPISVIAKAPARKRAPAAARARNAPGAARARAAPAGTPRPRAPAKPRAPAAAGARPRARAGVREVLDQEERRILQEGGVDDANSDEAWSEEDEESNSSDNDFIVDSSDDIESDELVDQEFSDDDNEKSEEEDEESDDDDDGEPEAVSDDYEDYGSDDSSEEDAILLQLVNEEKSSIEHDTRADEELKRLPIGLVMPSLAQRNAYKRYLTPIEIVLPMEDNYDACTILNLVRYIVDVAMVRMHSYKQHLNSVEARLHAINETRKKVPLSKGSTESTVLAYKFHLFLAEMLRTAIIENAYSPEATRFAQALLREDLTDGFFVYKIPALPGTSDGSSSIPMSPPRMQKYCAFTGKPADCIVVLRSYVTHKNVASLPFDSHSAGGNSAFTFARFWFLPYVVDTYVAKVVTPLWGTTAVPLHNRSAVSTHFDGTCQAELRGTVEAFADSIAELFRFLGYEVDIRHKFEFK